MPSKDRIILFSWVVILGTILYIGTRIVFINHFFVPVSLLKKLYLPLLHCLEQQPPEFLIMHLCLEKKLNVHPFVYLFLNYTHVVARCVHYTTSFVYHIIFMFGKIDF